jgi:hypothetical protein
VVLLQWAAIAACVILAALAVFQAALIAGHPLGRMAWGGQHEVLPRNLRIGSAVSIVLYAVFGYVALGKAGLVAPLGGQTGYFALGVVMNAISRSKPERLVMTPVALVLAVLYFVVAAG